MENRPDTAAGSVAPAGCSKWNEREKTRDGSKTTIKREDFTTEPFFSCRPAISNEPDFNRPSKCHLRQVGSVI